MKIPDQPHRRYNQLTGEWILVSPHRTARPWQGSVEARSAATRPSYEPACYLCPGNVRANGHQNPNYDDCFVFTNDFPAILPDTPAGDSGEGMMLRWQNVRGTSRVVCFSPRHDLTLAQMDEAGIRLVIDTWADQTQDLGSSYRWVQVFENKGEMMGASNPHPHGQIWAGDFLPDEPAKEDRNQTAYAERKGGNLLIDYVQDELVLGDRLVIENEHWAALVPFWAVWPFETILIPKHHVLTLIELASDQRDSLADIMKRLLIRYDNLFGTSFPYTMGWHGAPFDSVELGHWQLHAHFYPPLLRSADVRKFMVGYEMLAEPQRDISPEQAAERLRNLSERRFDE